MFSYLSSLGYPFRERPFVFFFSVVIVWAMHLALWAPVLGWIADFCFLAPFMCAFFMKIVRQSALGDDGICHFPEVENWLESFFLPYVRFIACVVVSFLPLFAYLNMTDWETAGFLFWFLVAVGLIYFPGAFMRTAVVESFDGLSPMGWWSLVKRAPLVYAGVVIACSAGLWVILSLPSGLLMDFAMAPVQLYITCVMMNVFGLFLLKHEFADPEEDDGFSVS